MHDILELLTQLADTEGASDLFVTVGAPPHIKAKGSMILVGEERLTSEDTRRMAEALMNEREKELFYRDLELNLAYTIPEKGRFRVNVFQQMNEIGLVARLIPLQFPTFDELGLPDVCRRLCMEKRGLILIVGATGSGKSTSLAAMLDHRNRNADGHIITVEDPVEFVHQHRKSLITHREVGTDTHEFHAALKSALRQAPDVILIGEIRDTETMEAAITFAETGHLVFGTLHANNANQAFQRIMNFFPAERHAQLYLQLSLNVRAIISQRLLKRADGTGRVAGMEIMINTPRIRDLILKGKIDEIKEAMKLSTGVGGQTFDQCLVGLFNDGVITEEQAIQESDSPNDVRILIEQLKTQRELLARKVIHQVVDFDVASRTKDVKGFPLGEDYCVSALHAALASLKALDLRLPQVLAEEADMEDDTEAMLLKIKPHPDVSIHGVLTQAAVRTVSRGTARGYLFELGVGARAIDGEGNVVYQHAVKDTATHGEPVRREDLPTIWKNLCEKACYTLASHMVQQYTPQRGPRTPAAGQSLPGASSA